MSIAQSILANPGKYSLEQLKQGVEDGVIPAYIGVPIIQEMLQNQSRGKAMGQEQMPPVMDQIMAQADQGLEALPSNLPQEYAGGGIIAFQNGGQTQAPMRFVNEGLVPEYPDELAGEEILKRERDAQLSPEEMTNQKVQSYVDRYKRLMPEKDPRMIAYEASLTKSPEELEARKSQDINMALAQLGLGLMGSKARTLAGGISEAAQPVLPSVQAALLARRTAEDTALKNRADLARADRAENIAALTGGVGMYEKEQERSSELAKEMAKRAAMAATGPKPTDMANFVSAYVRNAKDNPNNKLSDNALAIEGYKMYFAEGPKFAAPGIGAQMAIAGGQQAVQTAGQENTAFNNAVNQFNGLKSTDPIKREYRDLAKQDQTNKAAGNPTNLAETYRANQINLMAGRPITPAARVAPPAAPGVTPLAEKTMTRADVSATAKARGITEAEVEAAAKRAGYTIK
jgi:hypothetical protein